MALSGAEHSSPRSSLSRLFDRVKAWAGDGAQRAAGLAFAIRVASAGVVFVSQILLARWMGTAEFGTYIYAFTWLLIVGDIVHLGMPTAAQRYIPYYTQGGSSALLRGFLASSRWITFAMGTVVAVLGALLIRGLEPLLDPHTVMPLYFVCVALPFYTFSNTLDGLARSYDWVHIALAPPYILRPLILIAVMGAAHVAGFATDATAAAIALAAATWITALLQLVMLERGLAGKVEPGPKAYEFKAWFATSLPLIVVWGFFTLLTYTDVVVLQLFRPSAEVAVYYGASKTLMLVAFVYFSVGAAVAHHFTAFHVSGDRAGLDAFLAKAVRWTFWPSLAATILMLALGKPMLWLFGPAFVEGYPIMFVLAIGLIARASVGPAERLLNMLGEQRRCAMVYAAAFTMNVVGCFILAPRFGGMGVAASTATAIVVESALLFVVAKRRLGLHAFIWRPSVG